MAGRRWAKMGVPMWFEPSHRPTEGAPGLSYQLAQIEGQKGRGRSED